MMSLCSINRRFFLWALLCYLLQHPAEAGKKSVQATPSVNPSVDPTEPLDRMPTLFGPEEAQYDRYAACLAATEGLRKIRDKKLDSKRLKRRKGEKASEEQKRISAEYVLNSGKVLQAMGMSVSQFNQLGRELNQDLSMRERVMEQAYLYRMASTLDMERVPIVEDPASEELLQATRRQRLQMFCDSIQEIEQLRDDQLKKLKRSLHVAKLPMGVKLSDPSIMPFLSPKIRAVVEAFPLQAEEIVKKHGLHSDEFNKMMEKVKSNPVFRHRVENRIKQSK